MTRKRLDRRLRAAVLDRHGYHHRIPAPRLIAIVASSAIAVVKRARFAFT
jgi:hypothetical protein